MFENLPLSWPSFNFDVLCQPVVLQAVTRTEEKMAQFCPRRKDGAENQYSFNSIQYSLLLANIPVLSSLPPASRPITHPIQNETYILFNAVADCGFSFDILTFVRITSYSCGFCGCLIPNLSRAFYSHLFPVFFSPHRTFTFIFVTLSLIFSQKTFYLFFFLSFLL